MDLSKFNLTQQAEIGADLHLLDPFDDPLFYGSGKKEKPVTIKLLGTDSKVWRNKNREFQKKRTQKMVRNRAKNVDYSVSDEEAGEMFAACTTGGGGLEDKGEKIEFSTEAAFQMYMDHIWIREQADAFIADRANFFTKA